MTTSKRSSGKGGQFTSSQAESPANPPPEPGSRKAMLITAGSGLMLSSNFTPSDPLGRFSKILLESEMWASPEFYLTWKVSTTKCGCSVFRLVPSVPRTGGRGIGSWLTVSVEDAKREGSAEAWKEYTENGRTTCARLRNQVASAWPTPASRDEKGQTQNPERMDYVPNIVKASWPTPNAAEATRGPESRERCLKEHRMDKVGSYMNLAIEDVTSGKIPSGSLARTEKFVVRLMILSSWLMGYPWSYLKYWERKGDKRRKTAKPTEAS